MHERPRLVRRDEEVFRRRRRVALGVVAVLVLVPVILLARQLGGGGDEAADTPGVTLGETGGEEATGGQPADQEQTEAQKEGLGDDPETLQDAEAGIAAQYPASWSLSDRQGVHVIESPDECVAVAVSDPGTARRAEEVRTGAIAQLEQALGDGAVVTPGSEHTIGGLSASGATVSGGDGRTSLIAVAEGRRRAYLVQVTLASGGCIESLAGAQAILSSLQLTR